MLCTFPNQCIFSQHIGVCLNVLHGLFRSPFQSLRALLSIAGIRSGNFYLRLAQLTAGCNYSRDMAQPECERRGISVDRFRSRLHRRRFGSLRCRVHRRFRRKRSIARIVLGLFAVLVSGHPHHINFRSIRISINHLTIVRSKCIGQRHFTVLARTSLNRRVVRLEQQLMVFIIYHHSGFQSLGILPVYIGVKRQYTFQYRRLLNRHRFNLEVGESALHADGVFFPVVGQGGTRRTVHPYFRISVTALFIFIFIRPGGFIALVQDKVRLKVHISHRQAVYRHTFYLHAAHFHRAFGQFLLQRQAFNKVQAHIGKRFIIFGLRFTAIHLS